jgi:hypothetical protein
MIQSILRGRTSTFFWGQPLSAGMARGIAVALSFGSYVAKVAEVSVAPDGTPRVHRVVAAVDCGMVVNPEIIRHQIEGSIAMGLSAALHEQVTFQNGRPQQANFNTYRLLRMGEMPKVEVHIMPSTEDPGGIGEPAAPPLAPAVAEAAVVPSPDPVLSFVPKAYLILAPGHSPDGATAKAIFGFLRGRVSAYKMVRRIEFSDLPKTISGKIRRVELRAHEKGRPASGPRNAQEFLEESLR